VENSVAEPELFFFCSGSDFQKVAAPEPEPAPATACKYLLAADIFFSSKSRVFMFFRKEYRFRSLVLILVIFPLMVQYTSLAPLSSFPTSTTNLCDSPKQSRECQRWQKLIQIRGSGSKQKSYESRKKLIKT
jgi:hypothetical protein